MFPHLLMLQFICSTYNIQNLIKKGLYISAEPKKYGSQLIENNVFYTAAARLSFYATIIRLAYAEVKTIL